MKYKSNSKHSINSNIQRFIKKLLILLIIIFSLLIINKTNPRIIERLKEELFNKSLNFIKINKISKKLIGENILDVSQNRYLKVTDSDILLTDNKENYHNGYKYDVSNNLPIGTIQSGVIIYKGNKEYFGSTIIIETTDGYNIWYGNIKDLNVSLYDYVEKGSLIGSADGKYIYVLIEKNGKYYSYEDYKTHQD